MAEDREVVITGVGVVSPIGIGKDAFWQSLVERRSGVAFREMFRGVETRYRLAAEIKDFDPKQFIQPRKALKVMCREIQVACAAANLAMEDARLAVDEYDPLRLGVVLGSELFHCELSELEDVCRSCSEDGEFFYDRWGQRFMNDVFPLWFLKHLPNMPGCHISIVYDARGPNNTIVSDDCSSLHAIIEASHMIAAGRADMMMAGGIGSASAVATMIFRGEAELSQRIDDPSAASRPFDARRDGLVVGEGSGIFILESRDSAVRRGANIYARILGYGQSYSRSHDESSIKNSIIGAMRSSGLTANDIGHINAHGKSTRRDDCLEAIAINETLGQVPVTAPKSFFGSMGAGSGAVEMAASVLAFGKNEIPVTLNYNEPDPDCPINVIHEQTFSTDKHTSIVLSQTNKGQAAAIVLAAP